MDRFACVLLLLLALLAGCAVTDRNGAPDAARPDLLETYWRPVEIDSRPVVIHPGTREPHILLARAGGQVRGNTGCNTMGGAFRQDGEVLRFEKLVMTRRACLPAEGMAVESAFVKALESTASHRITGKTLELRDATGSIRMRLEAR